MLQYPTNVDIQNVTNISIQDLTRAKRNLTIDATTQAVGTFTFYGDRLSGVCCRITDYDTGEVVVDEFRSTMINNTYNGDGQQFILIEPNTLTNGHDYIFEMLLMQKKENEDLIYDIPVTGGTIMYSEGTTKFIDSDILSIYPWNYNSSSTTRTPSTYNETIVAEMIMKVGNEARKIVSYNPHFETETETYGVIVTDSAFNYASAGKQYEIYSNHIITPQYYLKCRDLPSVTLLNSVSDNRIHTNGTYTQTQDVGIKYYTLSLYWSNNEDFRNETVNDVAYITELVSETPRIYSQKIECDFEYPYRHDENFNNNNSPDYYKVVCRLVTNDDVEYSTTSSTIVLSTQNARQIGDNLYAFNLEFDKERGRVIYKLRGYGSSGGYTDVHQHEVFRKDMNTGEIVQLDYNYLRKESTIYAENVILVGCDATASVNVTYRYALRGITTGGHVVIPNIETDPTSPDYYDGIGKFPCNEITVKDYSYYISDLNFWYTANRKTHYKIGNTWKFSGEISDTTVQNNLDRTIHVNYNRYTSATSTNTNYMSGTLSAMLGYVNCSTKEYKDNMALVKAWRDFITQPKLFLLKSQKGDVWVVNITESPQTEYQENSPMIPTRFTFSWAESCSIDDVKIVDFYGGENA